LANFKPKKQLRHYTAACGITAFLLKYALIHGLQPALSGVTLRNQMLCCY